MSPRQGDQEAKDKEAKTYRSIISNVGTHLVTSFLGSITSTIYHRPSENRAELSGVREIFKVSVAKKPKEGFYAGLATFAALRLAPRVIASTRRARQYQLDAVVPTKRPGSVLLSVIKLGLDTAASSLVCYYCADVCFDPPILGAQIACLPLLEGRSTFSDSMCPVIQQQIARLPQEFWDRHEEMYPRQALVLANHCRLREQYERKLRSDQGLSPTMPVSIPPPGVPTVAEMIEGRAKQQEIED